jgi:hypothetical protein
VTLWVLVALPWVVIPQVAETRPVLVVLEDLSVMMVELVPMVQGLGRLAVSALEQGKLVVLVLLQMVVGVVLGILAFSGLVEQLAFLDFLVALWVLVVSAIQTMLWVVIPQVAKTQLALVELVDLYVMMVLLVAMVQGLGRPAQG